MSTFRLKRTDPDDAASQFASSGGVWEVALALFFYVPATMAFAATPSLLLYTAADPVGMDDGLVLFDLLHTLDGVIGQQLRHPQELPGAGQGAVLLLQLLTRPPEHRWPSLKAAHRGVIQRRRSQCERHQVMRRIEKQLSPVVAAPMLRDHMITNRQSFPWW